MKLMTVDMMFVEITYIKYNLSLVYGGLCTIPINELFCGFFVSVMTRSDSHAHLRGYSPEVSVWVKTTKILGIPQVCHWVTNQ